MHALRAGLKRNKERKFKDDSSDALIDRSTLPILGFQDFNEPSPAKNHMSWEPTSFQDDVNLLSSERLQTVSNRFQTHHQLHQTIGSLSENSMVHDLPEELTGDDARLLNPEKGRYIYEDDENQPPIDNHSKSKVMKFSRWKRSAHAGESKQPLLVESMADTSKVMQTNESNYPINLSRWDPIEHDETTEPLCQISTNNSNGIMSSKLHSNYETQEKFPSLKEKNQMMRGGDFDSRYRKNPKKTTKVIATFDPFEDADQLEQENDERAFQRQQTFSPATTNFQSSRVTENCQQSGEFHRADNARSSFQNFGNQHRSNAESSFNRKNSFMNVVNSDFHREMYVSEENRLAENDNVVKEKDLDQERPQERPNIHGVKDTIQYVEKFVVESENSQNEIERHHSRNEFRQHDIDYTEEHMENEGSKDVDEISTGYGEDVYSTRKMAHIRSIYDSKLSEAASNLQEMGTETIDPKPATSLHSEMVKDVGDNIGLRLVALFSEFSGTQKQRAEQERAIAILDARKLSNVERVDGSSQCNKDRRNQLFDISGERGKYPQFFLQKHPNIIIYLGDFEWLQYMNDIGSLNDDTIFGLSHSIPETHESTQMEEPNDEDMDVRDSHLQKSSDKSAEDRHLSFSDRATAFDLYKKSNLSYAIDEDDCLNSQADGFAESIDSGYALEATFQGDIDLESVSDIQSTVVNENGGLKNRTNPTDYAAAPENFHADQIYCEGASIETPQVDSVPKDSDVVNNEDYLEMRHSPICKTATAEASSELDGCTRKTEKLPLEQSEQELTTEIVSSSSSRRGGSGRRAILSSSKALLDEEYDINVIPSQSPSSPTVFARGATVTPTKTNQKENLYSDVDRYSEKNEDVENLSMRDNQMSKEEMEKQARRRARWKRRIIAEHLGKVSTDISEDTSNKSNDPIGASLTEIEMINTFFALLGPEFDGSMSSEELEDLRYRSINAGLTKEFTDKMSVGIRLRFESDPSIEETYDDRGFTRRTPQSQSNMDCLIDTFWAESSNIMGGDMVENIQAALSGDEESKRGQRSTDKIESKSRWRSGDMIESIKATLSGESGEKGWSTTDMIGNIKASLSSDSGEKGWRSMDVIGNIKASLSGDNSERGWSSSGVIGSIKAALSTDSENKDESRYSVPSSEIMKPASSDDTKPDQRALEERTNPHIENGDAADELVNDSLHEC